MAPRSAVIWASVAVRALTAGAVARQAELTLPETRLDLELALSAEGTACTAGSTDSDACDLHLLQVRAKGISEVALKKHQSDDNEEAMSSPKDDALDTDKKAPSMAMITTTGECTAQDEAKMQHLGGGNGKNSFPGVVAVCGKSAYWWLRFHTDHMRNCIQEKVGLGPDCAQCFAAAGQYGFDNCKMQCLFGSWCSDLCRGCTGVHDHVTQQCAGVNAPQPARC